MMRNIFKYGMLVGVFGFCSMAWADGLVFRPDLEKSNIHVDVKATIGSFVGEVTQYQASFESDDQNITALTGSLSFDFKDLETGEEKRNQHMWEWMGYESYPQGRFVLSKILESTEGTFAVGRIEAVGVTREVQFPITITRTENELSVDGELEVNYQDFNLDLIRMAFVIKVNPVFTMKFHLEGPLLASEK